MGGGSRQTNHRISTRKRRRDAIHTRPGPIVVLGALGLFLCLPKVASTQNDTGDNVRFRLRTSVDLVLVPVTVKDAKGKLVVDLQRGNFRLLEDGVEQSIRHFSADPFPLSAVILVDAGLERSAHQAVQKSLPVLASAFAPQDEFSLYVFDTYPRQVLDFTRDTEQLLLALGSIAGEPSQPARGSVGVTGGPMTAGARVNTVPLGPGVASTVPQAAKPVKSIHDALFAAGMALRTRERGRRRVVFILSDGRNSRLNIRSFDETRDLLLAEDVSVYAIGVGNARFTLGTTVLSDYARATGGDFYALVKQNSLARIHMRVTEQARYQYTLLYAARPASGSREYRRIEVEVNRPGVTVRARAGYFAGIPRH